MEYLGEHNRIKVYWWDFSELYEELPYDNWVCFAMTDWSPNYEAFEKFARNAVEKRILEFKAYGNFSEQLHDVFDEIVVAMEELENYPELNVMTTWHDDEGLASAFWQCFYVTCLPKTTNYNDLKLVCIHFDKTDKRRELKTFLQKFNEGWIPSDQE